MHRFWRLAFTWTIAVTPAASPAGADEKLKAYGKHLSAECTACHRIDGIDNGIPSIVGWPVADFKAALESYRSGARDNPVMVSVAQSLDARQIEALATYFGALAKPGPTPARGATSRK